MSGKFLAKSCALLLVLMLFAVGCGKAPEPVKPPDRWKLVHERTHTRYFLDTQSVVKMQTDKATVSVTDSVKRELISYWIKAEPIPGKEDAFAKEYGKDIGYILAYSRVDKINREWMAIEATAYKKDNTIVRHDKDAAPQFKPIQPNSIAEKIINML